MRIAVLTLTRDRLAYTQHCFEQLREHAGCDFDHYVLDQGSTDGTYEWLMGDTDTQLLGLEENVGIHHGMNHLLDLALHAPGGYDAVVKFDNDCELLQPDTLRDVCELALAGDAILSPIIEGIGHPPHRNGTFRIGSDVIEETRMIGGIFMAAPAWIFGPDGGFRFDEELPTWGGADSHLCAWFRRCGGRVGYVQRLAANHYLTTVGQERDLPEYFARVTGEGAPA